MKGWRRMTEREKAGIELEAMMADIRKEQYQLAMQHEKEQQKTWRHKIEFEKIYIKRLEAEARYAPTIKTMQEAFSKMGNKEEFLEKLSKKVVEALKAHETTKEILSKKAAASYVG